jgi:arylsulfatase A-like enzyme
MKTNIVYIHCHDAGQYVQPYGHAVPTPNLQRLAEQGILFRKAFCMAPTCSPSRAALLTGQAPHSAGMCGVTNPNLGGFALNDMGRHIVHTLRRAGYTSGRGGFQHVAEDAKSIGYDQVLDVPKTGRSRNGARDVGPRAAAFLESAPAEPFFLDVGAVEPHSIMTTDPACDPANPSARTSNAIHLAAINDLLQRTVLWLSDCRGASADL